MHEVSIKISKTGHYTRKNNIHQYFTYICIYIIFKIYMKPINFRKTVHCTSYLYAIKYTVFKDAQLYLNLVVDKK
jgi:hypothetical protein